MPIFDLISKKKFFDAIYQDMSEAVILADSERRIVKMNAAAESMFGYKEAELVGQHTAIVYAEPDDYYKQGRRRFNPQAVVASERYRIHYRRKSGEIFPSETIGSTVRDEQGEVRGYLGIIHDLSDQERMEHCLHDLYTISTDQGLSGGAKVDAMLKLGCEYFGLSLGIVSKIDGDRYEVRHVYTHEAALAAGASFDLGDTYCVHTLQADDVVAYDEVADSEIANHPCYRNFNLEAYIGVPLIVRNERFGTLNFSDRVARPKPFTAADREFVRLFASWIAQELSQQWTMQDLMQARLEAERANATKSRFLATMSHELRTPLTGVLGMLDLLRTTDLSDEQAAYVTDSRDCASGLLDLLNDVLDLSKIEAGALQLETMATDVAKVVGSAAAPFKVLARRKGVALRVEGPADCWIYTDPTRLRQIVTNLVSNAVKFTEEGEVRVTYALTPEGADRARLDIAVQDNGPGIASDHLETVFLPFRQADDSITRRYGGTGLGLAISRRLARALNGDIGVESQPGKGASFQVSFLAERVPPQTGEGKAKDAATVSQAPVSQPLDILVAEDNAVNARLLVSMLERQGHHVTPTANGAEALEAAQNRSFDIAIFDLQMPVLDGLSAVHRLRTLPAPAGDLPIIGLSADANVEGQRTDVKSAFSTLLAKPIDWESLLWALYWHTRRGQDPAADDKPAPPLIDETHLRSLVDSLGLDWVANFIADAERDIPALIGHAREQALSGAQTDVAPLLHSIKGAALNIGACRLGEAAEYLNRRLRETALPGSDTIAEIDALAALAANSMDALFAWTDTEKRASQEQN